MSPVLSAGVDTYALLSESTATHNGQPILQVATGAAVAYVYLPVTGIPLAATLTTATLRLYTSGSWGITPTVTATPVDAAWGASTLTWANAPASTGTTTTVTHASAADADEFAFDVTPQVSAMLTSFNYGFAVERTDVDTTVTEFYSHEHETFAPSLELTWAITPDPPTNIAPSGGHFVATTTPVVSFDAADVTAVQVQIDSTAGDFSSPEFDSGTVVTDVAELDLSTTAYVGLDNVDHSMRVRYKNSSGLWSAWSDVVHIGYRAHQSVTPTNPSADADWIVVTDTPTITATTSGTVASYRITVAPADDPFAYTFDTTATGPTIATTLPEGVITDSSDLTLTLEVFDTLDREAVPGFPIAATVTETFSFSGTGAVPPVDDLFVAQVGSGPFNELIWTRNHRPDKWQIRRDGQILMSVDANDIPLEDDDTYHWIDYTAAGGTVHHYRVAPKVGSEVAAGGPTYDIVTNPRGIWVGDPYRQLQVRVLGTDSGSWSMGEAGTTYNPLRGTDAIHITQSTRGYEGTITGVIFSDHETNGVNDYIGMRAIRHIPNRDYVIALPYLSFVATIFNVTIAPTPAAFQQFSVSFDFVQQGTTLWEGSTVPGASKLLASYDYEEGTNGVALTTSTNVGAVSTLGAPVYQTSAALHGNMGFNIPASGTGGSVTYAIPTIGIAQIYLTPRASADVGNLCKLVPASAGTVSSITMRQFGDFGINDAADANVVKSAGIYEWIIDRPLRVQILWAWSPGLITIIVRLFGSLESPFPTDTFSATFPALSAPAFLVVGNGTNKKSTDYDSVDIYAGNETWPEPIGGASDDPAPVWSIPGWPTHNSIAVQSLVNSAATISLAYSTNLSVDNDPVTPTYSSVQTIDANSGLVRHSITGLTSATTYYAKLSPTAGVFAGDVIKFKTLPAPATAFTTKIVVGSCQRNAAGSETDIAYLDALAYDADLQWHLGDLAYMGAGLDKRDPWTRHLSKYTSHIVALSSMRQLMQQTASCYLGDDHEFSSNNGESNDSTDTGKVRAVAIDAMQRIFPMYPLGDTAAQASKRGLYGTAMLGSNVRLIWLDGESLDRSLGTLTDSSTKTFIGATQEAWLRNTLTQPAVVNVIITGKSLLGTSAALPDAANLDKPWNYGTWRADLANYIATTLTIDAKPIKVIWVGGDRHANAYVSKADNPIMPGHPAIIASGWEQHGLPQKPGEDYTASYGWDDAKVAPSVQYVQMTIADNNGGVGSGLITMTFKSRETHNTYSGGAETDPAGWTIVDGWGGTTYTETWTY